MAILEELGLTPHVHRGIGVDVGGTKIAAALVDSDGRITHRVQRATDVSGVEATLTSIQAAIEAVLADAGPTASDIVGVGLGIPGKVDPVRGLGLLSVNLGWRDAPVVATLEAALGVPCRIENDVSVGALGEARYGAGRGRDSLVYLSLGTGVAARTVIEGRLYRGAGGLAGELGHLVADPDSLPCKCGARGCLEAIASGPGIAARAQQAVDAGAATTLRELAAGGPVTTRMVFAAADAGDALAQAIVERTGQYLGRAVEDLIMLYDPDIVVLGGGLAQAGNRLTAAIVRELDRLAAESYVFRDMWQPERLAVSALGPDVALLGAAALAL